MKDGIDVAFTAVVGMIKGIRRQLFAMQQIESLNPRHRAALAIAGKSHRQNKADDVRKPRRAIDKSQRKRAAHTKGRIADNGIASGSGRRPLQKIGALDFLAGGRNIQREAAARR